MTQAYPALTIRFSPAQGASYTVDLLTSDGRDYAGDFSCIQVEVQGMITGAMPVMVYNGDDEARTMRKRCKNAVAIRRKGRGQ